MQLQSIVLAMMICAMACQQTCWPEFILPNILKDSVTLNYNDPSENTFTYIYFAALLQGQPNIAYTISQLQIEQVFASLNYYLNAELSDNKILFKFNAPNNKWRIVNLHFFLNSRNDLFISKHLLTNIRSEQRVLNISITNDFTSSNTNTLNQVTFIVGLFCNYTNDIQLSVVEGDANPANAVVYVNAGPTTFITNITIVSVIYSSSSAQFTSSAADLTFKSFKSQYYNLFKDFLPIYYYLTGITAFSLNNFHQQTFNYQLQIINLSILNATALNTFKSITLTYLAISAFTSKICCGNYFNDGECIESCLDGYPLTYQDGGKACIPCDALVGLKLNQLAKSCACLPNYELLKQNQCIPIKSQNVSCRGTNEILGNQGCICSPGTFNLSGVCSSCPANQLLLSGQCVNRSSEISCGPNELLLNSECVCNINSVKRGSVCALCGQKTFVDKANNICNACIDNCIRCINKVTCLQCNPGFIFDLSALKCNDNENTPAQMLVTTLSGFPKYTNRAVLIDFQVKTNYTIKSDQQLKKIITSSFSNQNFAPLSIEYFQNPVKPNHIRALFNYFGAYPLMQFTVSLVFWDVQIGLEEKKTFTLNYGSNVLAYEGI